MRFHFRSLTRAKQHALNWVGGEFNSIFKAGAVSVPEHFP